MPSNSLSGKHWIPSPISLRDGKIFAAHCICRDYAECLFLQKSNWQAIAEKGGMLIIKVQEAELVEERIPGIDKVFYKYDGPPVVQLWHFPELAFDTALKVAREWGFPSDTYVSKRPNIWGEIHSLLIDMDVGRVLSVERISPDFLILRKRSSVRLELDKLNAVMEFNISHFGVNLTAPEKDDQLRHWYKQNFFSVGAI